MRDIEQNIYIAAPVSSAYVIVSHHERRRLQNHLSPTLSSLSSTRRSKQSLLSASKLADSIFSTAIMICLALVVVAYLQVERLDQSSSTFRTSSLNVDHSSKPPTLVFSSDGFPSELGLGVSLPELQPLDDDGEEDYGNLEIGFFQHEDGRDEPQQRQIYKDYLLERLQYRSPYENRDDDLAPYYAFDDDAIKGDFTCRRISDHRLNFQNCNNFHEQHLVEEHMTFLGEGAFREVFGLEHSYSNQVETFVLKELRFDADIDEETSEYIRMDASVAERLSASPRTFDVYGFCGVGILSEFFFHGDIEDYAYGEEEEGEVSGDLRAIDHLVVQNDLSGREKLVLALEMAEGVALLHGFGGGVIVHDDIQLSQFLLNKEKTMLKINDFNRAEYMLYDDSEQDYCMFYNGVGPGTWRSPEEYKDEALNEKIDVWSLGNNMYTLLTGLDPFSWLAEGDMKALVKGGETAYIDPRFWMRSKEEAKLAGIIKQCFEYNPNTRPSVFDVVEQLRMAVVESLGNNITREEVLQGLDE